MNKKGFSGIVVIIGIVIIVGIGGYFIFNYRSSVSSPILIASSTSSKLDTDYSETENIKLDLAKESIQLFLSSEQASIKFTGELTLNMKMRNLTNEAITISTNFSKLVFLDPSGQRTEYTFSAKDTKNELTLVPGDNNFASFTDSFISEWFLNSDIYLPHGCQSNELNPLYGPCAKLSIMPKGKYQITWLFGEKKSNTIEVEID